MKRSSAVSVQDLTDTFLGLGTALALRVVRDMDRLGLDM